MKKMNRGTLFVVTGPSGTGKGTVLHQVLEDLEDVVMSVSATTRQPRAGEVHGVHYYFLTREEFEAGIAEGNFLEHAQYVENFYGTLARPVEENLALGRDVILEIEVKGALQVQQKRPDAVLIFIAPPSFEELERRLVGRGTESLEKIQKRLTTAKEEMEQMDRFDYVVVNDEVHKAAKELEQIVRLYRNTEMIRG